MHILTNPAVIRETELPCRGPLRRVHVNVTTRSERDGASRDMVLSFCIKILIEVPTAVWSILGAGHICGVKMERRRPCDVCLQSAGDVHTDVRASAPGIRSEGSAGNRHVLRAITRNKVARHRRRDRAFSRCGGGDWRRLVWRVTAVGSLGCGVLTQNLLSIAIVDFNTKVKRRANENAFIDDRGELESVDVGHRARCASVSKGPAQVELITVDSVTAPFRFDCHNCSFNNRLGEATRGRELHRLAMAQRKR